MSSMQIEQRHRDIIDTVLKKFPNEYYLFGSRAKGTAKALSDLDLLVKKPITKVNLAELREAFEESNLPFKVDIVIWDQLDDAFRAHIVADLKRL